MGQIKKLNKKELIDARNAFIFADYIYNPLINDDSVKKDEITAIINSYITDISVIIPSILGKGWSSKDLDWLKAKYLNFLNEDKFKFIAHLYGFRYDNLKDFGVYKSLADYIKYVEFLKNGGSHTILTDPVKDTSKVADRLNKIIKKEFSSGLLNLIGLTKFEFFYSNIKDSIIDEDVICVGNTFLNIKNETPNSLNDKFVSEHFLKIIIKSNLFLLIQYYQRQLDNHKQKKYDNQIETLFVSAFRTVINCCARANIKKSFGDLMNILKNDDDEDEYPPKPVSMQTLYLYKIFRLFSKYRQIFWTQIKDKNKFNLNKLEIDNHDTVILSDEIDYIDKEVLQKI